VGAGAPPAPTGLSSSPRLPYPGAVDLDRTFRAYAEEHVRVVRQLTGLQLDYSPASLAACDRLVDEGWGGQLPRQLEAAVNLFGAYLGEVIVRTLGGRWEVDDRFGVCVVGLRGTEARAMPLLRAARRFLEGPAASFEGYYEELLAALELVGAPPAGSDL
jgi:hypothetical protein